MHLFFFIFSFIHFLFHRGTRNTSTLESLAYNYKSNFKIPQPWDFTWKVNFIVASSQVDSQDICLFNIAWN